LKNEGTIEFGELQLKLLHKLDNRLIVREQVHYAVERFWIGDIEKCGNRDGDVTKGSLMAGQLEGIVDEVKPLKSIIDEMIDDPKSELKRLQRIFIAEFEKKLESL